MLLVTREEKSQPNVSKLASDAGHRFLGTPYQAAWGWSFRRAKYPFEVSGSCSGSERDQDPVGSPKPRQSESVATSESTLVS